jgi:3-oxoacyl-[acyl-carrier protein] reductase
MTATTDKSDLTSNVYVITGASSGVGQAAARQLVSAGARVGLGARRKERLDQLVEELGSDNAVAVPCDVRNPGDCRSLTDATVAAFGRLDGVIASAGLGMYGGILDGSDDELSEMIETNYAGTVWAVRAATSHLLSEGGDIVIIASVAGLRGGANEAVYAGTKFAQIGLAGAIDRELRPHGIRVSTLAPAAIATEFALGRGRTVGDAWLDEVLTADDVAEAVVTILEQPRRLRTQLWSMWAMAEGS